MIISPVTDPAALERVYASALAPSFPDTELVPLDAFLAAANAGEYDVLVARDGDTLLGALVVAPFASAALIHWLAVTPESRGTGTGSALIDAARTRWASRVTLLLAEVERPDVFPAHPRHGDPVRRLALYARLGFTALDVPYFQPPIVPGAPPVPGLLLTVVQPDLSAEAPRALTSGEHLAVADYLLTALADDPGAAAARVRDRLADPAGLHVLPLDAYATIPLSE